MYPRRVRDDVRGMLAAGHSVSEVSRRTGIHRATVAAWRDTPTDNALSSEDQCPRCGDSALDGAAYAALLGYYLGDGCLSRAARYVALRVACDAQLPGIIQDVESLIRAVRPAAKVFRVAGAGVVMVQSHWQHWPCLFPQHGPGRKHDRPIVLDDWQRHIVEAHPGPFPRGHRLAAAALEHDQRRASRGRRPAGPADRPEDLTPLSPGGGTPAPPR